MRNYFAKQSNPTRFILHWSITLFDNILLLKNIEKEDIVQHSRFSINELFQISQQTEHLQANAIFRALKFDGIFAPFNRYVSFILA